MKIHIHIPPQVAMDPVYNIQMTAEALLVLAHRRGEHPWGSMRRECPLCQRGK